MKILFLINKVDYGGAENYVIDLANALTGEGHQIIIAAAPGRGNILKDPAVKSIPINFRQRYLLPLQILNLVKIIQQNKIEIIHANQKRPILAGVIAGWITRTPVAATLHGKLHRDLPYQFVRRKLSRLITVCDYWLEVIRLNDPDLYRKSVRIFNGIKIEPAVFHKESEPKLVYASRLNRPHSKVIKLLISEVLPQLVVAEPDLYLEVIGDGGCYSELNKLATQTNQRFDKAVIRMAGYQENIRPALTSARLVLGVGRVALEALAIGTPVVAVNHRHLGGLVSRENISYFMANNFLAREEPPPDATSVLSEIRKSIAKREDGGAETKVLQEVILQEFDLDKVVKQILALYESIAGIKD